MSDSEEEILVYAELEDDVEIEGYKNVNVLGINSKNPVIQMGDTFFTGKYENPLGTYMFFKDAPPPKDADPLFDKIPEKNLAYVCKAKKFIKMEHAYITPKENDTRPNIGNELQSTSEIDLASFKTFEEGIEKFKHYWDTVTENSKEKVKDTNNSSTSSS